MYKVMPLNLIDRVCDWWSANTGAYESICVGAHFVAPPPLATYIYIKVSFESIFLYDVIILKWNTCVISSDPPFIVA